MFINDSYVTYSEQEAQNVIADLRNEGYHRLSNSFWYEIGTKGEHVVVLERDF